LGAAMGLFGSGEDMANHGNIEGHPKKPLDCLQDF